MNLDCFCLVLSSHIHVSQCEFRLFLPCFVQSYSCESVCELLFFFSSLFNLILSIHIHVSQCQLRMF